MDQTAGKITIDGREIVASQAECTLMFGRLRVNTASPQIDWSFGDIPVGDHVEYPPLSKLIVSMPDCINAAYENPWFKPYFSIGKEYYSIRSLRVEAGIFIPEANLLPLTFDFTAIHTEDDTQIFVAGNVTAECQEITSFNVLLSHETFPVRFAARYLPLLGLPPIPVGTTREQIIDLFGTPNYEGGGLHPPFGNIPEWILYILPNCTLRFEFSNALVTHITVDESKMPFWEQFHHL